MPLIYITKLPEIGFAQMFEAKSEESKAQRLPPEDKVVLDPDNGENDQDWVFAFRKSKPATKGWIPMRFLREPEPGDEARFPLAIKPFVRSCGRAELFPIQNSPDGSTSVLADYLIAWAFLESATAEAKITNPPANFVGSDAEGPFRLTSADWAAYQAAAKASGVDVSEFERLIPNSQVSGAAFKALRDADALAALQTPGPAPVDGPYVPSYLNVFHAHLIGPETAHRFQKLKDENGAALKVDAALDGHPQKAEILANRASFMIKDGSPTTVGMFFEITSQALADGFRKALELIREHADFLLPELNPVSGGAPWMKVAQEELDLWTSQGLDERSGPGLEKVIQYFKSVNVNTDRNDHWCGAFVAHCLAQSNPSFQSTIVKEGAQAAKWIAWGNASLRQFDLRDVPVGAIVVTHPLSEGTSGHVGFAVEKVTGTDKIVVLGGNQGDRVSLMHVHKNKIRQIRWHTEVAVATSSQIGTSTEPKFAPLLSLIASHESQGNYNAHFGNIGNKTNPKFTAMSLAQVRGWQDAFVASGQKSSAVGKYQIIRSTLDALIQRLNLPATEVFDENLQDRMAINLLENRRLADYLSAQIDVVEFGNRLAMEWASFPVLSRIVNSKRRVVRRGESFYAGDGLNKAHVMPEQVEAALLALV